MPEATLDLLSNAGLVCLCLVAFMLAKNAEGRLGRHGVPLVVGISFGLIAGAMTLAPIRLVDNVPVDLHASMMFLSAFTAGPIAGLLAVTMSLLARLLLAVPDAFVTTLGAVGCMLTGWVARQTWRQSGRRWLALRLVGATIVLCAIATLSTFAADRAAGLEFLRTVLPSYAAVMLLIVVSLGFLLQQESEHFESMMMLREAHRRAMEADQAKAEFLARMTHELRTPLNAILGFSEMIKLGMGGNDVWKYVEYGEDIHRSGMHLLSLVNDVLDASRLQHGPVELHESRVSLVAVAHEVARNLRSLTSKKGLLVEVELQGFDAVMADERALRQILTNLLGNAIRHAPERSALTITAWREGEALHIGVRDRGPGIPMEKRAHLTEPFGAIDRDWRGSAGRSGLGLSIVHSLAIAHGGRLFVSDPPSGNGVIVGITLPAGRIVRVLPALAA